MSDTAQEPQVQPDIAAAEPQGEDVELGALWDEAAPAAEPEPEAAAAPAKEEPAKEEEPAAESEPVSDRIAQLKAREAAIEAREAEAAERHKQLEELNAALQRAKEDPLALLDKLGLSFADLIERAAGSEPQERQAAPEDANVSPEIREIRAELKALKAEREKERAEREEQLAQYTAAQQKAAVEAHAKAIEATARGGDERWELVNIEGAYDLALEVTRQHWQQNKEILPIEQALDTVEKHLEERARKLTAAKKLAAALAPKPAAPAAEAPKTLSNRMHSESRVPVAELSLDPMERDKELAASLRFWD